MDRTYNFQVDNGLFVAEYYINKNYKDITIDDLKSSTDMFVDIMWKLVSENNVPSKTDHYRLSTQSHNNSFLNQHSRTRAKLHEQLSNMLKNIGSDKTCMSCGEKKVNAKYTPSNLNVFLAGTPSTNNFFNRSNNLQTVDICPICMFLAYISFLNTQKISYPFLFISDSDEFMRDITSKIQSSLQSNMLLDIKQSGVDQYFVETMSNLTQYKAIYDDMNYIDLIYFQNGKSNYYNEQTVSTKNIIFLLKLKNKGLINEFYKLRLFRPLLNDKLTMAYLIDYKTLSLRCSTEMLKEIKEEVMTKEEIGLIEYATNAIIKHNDIEDVLKELKMCNNRGDFERFIISYSQKEPLYSNLDDFVELVDKYYKYKGMLIANLLLKGETING